MIEGEAAEQLRVAVGLRLRALRKLANYSQRAVELRTFGTVTQASLSNYEGGKRDIPLAAVFELSTVYHVDPQEFVRMVQGDLDDD